MKVFYCLFILFCLAYCSNDIQFHRDNNTNGYNGFDLGSEDGDLCDGREICSIQESFSLKDEETALDILFILDVSESMYKDLEKLGKSMQSLLSEIHAFDWQIAFTTADHGDHRRSKGKIGHQSWKDYQGDDPHFGRLMNLEFRGKKLNKTILKKTDSAYGTIFLDTLNMENPLQCKQPQLPQFAPYCQSDHEQPLRALLAAIERNEDSDFFRDKANFITIIVTNEDERVEDPENATTAQEVHQSFKSLFPAKTMYGFGIIVQDEDCYNKMKTRSRVVEYGERVGELARVTGGRNISICENDYKHALNGISKLIRRKIYDRVHLVTAEPDPSSVEVEMYPHQQDVRWEVRGQEIVFSSPLQTGTQVEVTYFPL